MADRELTPFSTIIDCNKRPNNTIIEGTDGKLWSISANGTCFLEKANTSLPLHPKYKFPIIRGFNAKLAREQEVSLPRHSMLQIIIIIIITASHTTLNQLNHFSITEGGGDFFHGLGSIIGKAISAVTTGGSSLLRAAGAGLKESFEGLGDFSGKVAHGFAETTGTLITSSGQALHDVETGAGSLFNDMFGGLGGAVLWGIALLLLGYFLFTRFKHRCFKSPPLPHTVAQHPEQPDPPTEDYHMDNHDAAQHSEHAACPSCSFPIDSMVVELTHLHAPKPPSSSQETTTEHL